MSGSGFRVGRHEGYDRITFEFETPSGIPVYELSRKTSAHFIKDPSGLPLDLDGAAGLTVVFRGTSVTADVQPTRARPSYPIVREIALAGNFEAVVTYDIGLAAPACLRVLELSEPARVVIDFENSLPAAGPGR